jgi:hypothetical protein
MIEDIGKNPFGGAAKVAGQFRISRYLNWQEKRV